MLIVERVFTYMGSGQLGAGKPHLKFQVETGKNAKYKTYSTSYDVCTMQIVIDILGEFPKLVSWKKQFVSSG